MLLQSCLGLTVDGWEGGITLHRPALPEGLDLLHLRGLALGADRVDLTFERSGDRVTCLPKSRNGDALRITLRE